YNIGTQSIQVLVDGSVVGTVTPSSSNYAPYALVTGVLAAGNHTITFQGLATTDATAFLDQVAIN
ncbi:MAG TPA: hypothetical protein VG713_09095, partial [Pirellulales bacterium]|nr:hypothetical protein [Pirellulales bacterium]